MSARFVPALAAALWLAAPPAFATPVGTTPDTRPAAPQQRASWQTYGFGAQWTGTGLAGNVNLINSGASLNANANWGAHQVFLDAGHAFTQAGSTVLVNRFAGSALYAYAVRDNMNIYGYTTHATDQSIKLDYRVTNGLGLCRHKLALPDFSLLLFSFGPVHEVEYFKGLPGPLLQWRGVVRLNGVRPLTDRLEAAFDSVLTPAFPDPGDFRVFGEVALKVKLTDVLSAKLTLADEYDSRPLAGVQNNDLGLFTTLAAEWGR